MTTTKVYIPPVVSTRDITNNCAFWFSDDLEVWMHSKSVGHKEKQRAYDRAKAKGTGRMDRSSHTRPEDL